MRSRANSPACGGWWLSPGPSPVPGPRPERGGLRAYALGRATPTLVAVSVAINPVTASLCGVLLLGETIGPSLVIGLAAVLVGIAVASSGRLSLIDPPAWRSSSAGGGPQVGRRG
jgi:hypothetical protein